MSLLADKELGRPEGILHPMGRLHFSRADTFELVEGAALFLIVWQKL